MSDHEIRVIDRFGIVVFPAPGKSKAEVRAQAVTLAQRAYPAGEGYRHKWSGDCRMVFRGTEHVADFACEPMEASDDVAG